MISLPTTKLHSLAMDLVEFRFWRSWRVASLTIALVFLVASVSLGQESSGTSFLQIDEADRAAVKQLPVSMPAAIRAELVSDISIDEVEPMRVDSTSEFPSTQTPSELDAVILDASSASVTTVSATRIAKVITDGRSLACIAGANSAPAEVLTAHARSIASLYEKQSPSDKRGSEVVVRFLQTLAKREREVSAANALRAYYGRSAIQEQLQNIELAESQVAEVEAKIEALRQARGESVYDPTVFARQRNELLDQRLQLQQKDNELRMTLQRLLGDCYCSVNYPLEPLEILPLDFQCDRMVSHALANRIDNYAWQCLCRSINEDTANAVAATLSGSISGFGLPLRQLRALRQLIGINRTKSLESTLRAEVCLAARILSEEIKQDVCLTCQNLKIMYERIEVSKATIASWEERLGRIETFQGQGGATAESRFDAISARLKAQSVDIERRLEAKLLEVRLADGCGGLYNRCCAGSPWLVVE